MREEAKQGRRLLLSFTAIAFLVLAQVAWWTTVLFTETERVEALTVREAELSLHSPELVSAAREKAHAEGYHRRVMFVCESLTFALLTLVAFFLLFRAFRKEREGRRIQRNFIEIFSHECKTPLTALQLQLQAVRRTAPVSETHALDGALEQVRRLSSLVEKTLNLHRAESHALQFEAVALGDLVQEVNRRLRSWVTSHGGKIELRLLDEGWIRGDIHGLQNVVQSLLENAILYNGRTDPTVVVALSREGNEVRLTVEDNGPGIQTDDAEKIFQRYYRGHGRGKVSGTGLGLYLAKYIVEAHRGIIRWVKPVSGVGSLFEIRLPGGEVPA